MQIKSDILLVCPERFPDEAISRMIAEVESEDLSIAIQKRDLGVLASLEWAIPGIISAYIAKSYFDGFLKEAGKDHYSVLKSWLSNLAVSARLIKVKTLTSSGSPNKVDESNHQSKSISIYLPTTGDVSIKLLFDENLSDNQWREAIEKIVDHVREHIYDDQEDDFISMSIKRINRENIRTLYAIIDPATLDWEILDDRELAVRHRK